MADGERSAQEREAARRAREAARRERAGVFDQRLEPPPAPEPPEELELFADDHDEDDLHQAHAEDDLHQVHAEDDLRPVPEEDRDGFHAGNDAGLGAAGSESPSGTRRISRLDSAAGARTSRAPSSAASRTAAAGGAGADASARSSGSFSPPR